MVGIQQENGSTSFGFGGIWKRWAGTGSFQILSPLLNRGRRGGVWGSGNFIFCVVVIVSYPPVALDDMKICIYSVIPSSFRTIMDLAAVADRIKKSVASGFF